jgi:hypothetical protein
MDDDGGHMECGDEKQSLVGQEACIIVGSQTFGVNQSSLCNLSQLETYLRACASANEVGASTFHQNGVKKLGSLGIWFGFTTPIGCEAQCGT